MSIAAWHTAALAALLAVWWMTEALPLGATSLLPIILLPLLGVTSVDAATAPYANPTIFLFLGGFLIALAVERSGLHRRAALTILGAAGTRPSRLVGGFMLATAVLSMWISNTAATLMMLPMATSVLTFESGSDVPGADSNLGPAILLGVAYAASIGGLGTLIGTPPNALLAAYMTERFEVEIGFGEWMLVGVPLVILALPLCWLLITRVACRVDDAMPAGSGLEAARAGLGPMSRAEWLVGTIMLATALAWMFRPLLQRAIPPLNDATIAIAGALLLFAVPVHWKRRVFPLGAGDLERIPWSVLLLFGGGLSLAAAIESSGLADWMGHALGALGGWPLPLLLLAMIATTVYSSELASNTAAAATFLPIVGALAVGLGVAPMTLVVPTALAASCGFMLPVSTPPNAIVYGTGRISIGRMIRTGFLLNLLMIGILMAAAFSLIPWALGTGPGPAAP